jgi:hypothetical protein
MADGVKNRPGDARTTFMQHRARSTSVLGVRYEAGGRKCSYEKRVWSRVLLFQAVQLCDDTLLFPRTVFRDVKTCGGLRVAVLFWGSSLLGFSGGEGNY